MFYKRKFKMSAYTYEDDLTFFGDRINRMDPLDVDDVNYYFGDNCLAEYFQNLTGTMLYFIMTDLDDHHLKFLTKGNS